jgi:ATP-dependent Clp protease protease subunit
MATLKIFNDIVGEEEKIMLQMWEGIDGICFKDIDEFISSMDKDDNEIDIRIHCRGGDCVEGWAIYDKLRRSKKTISCTVEGECSSMATIILLAAPLERRYAYKNAHFCIHNPALGCPEIDYAVRLTADALDKNIDQLKIQSQALREEQQKILNLYVARTTAARNELQALMDKDTYISTDKAIELGFIVKALSPLTASKTRTFNISSKTKTMSKKTTTVEKSLLKRLLAKAGVKKITDLSLRAQVVTAADGTELTVEREDGDPQVGDAASPDGNFVLEDGTEIIVEDGVITSIIDPEGNVTDEGMDEEELVEKVEELETENEELVEENEELKEELEALKRGGARVLSADEKVILAKVNKAGGRKWLERVLDSKSTYTSQNRRFVEGGRRTNAGESSTQARIREQRAAADAKRAARRK